MAITPLNPLVRTMLTSLHGAMSRGMPVDQAVSYVKSMAQQGIAPLIDLPAMLQQYQQLKQPETPPLQTPTVREQIAAATQARQGGIPMGTMPVAQPMAQGLGGLDAGRMENPQGFNQGGIVAFDNGGPAASTPPVTAANLPKPRTDQELYNYYAGIMGQGYVPAFKTQESELEAIEKEQGIGEFAKSLEEEKGLLEKQEKRSLEELEMDKANLRRQEAADIAGYATKSRSALEAMAKARSASVTRERELEKEIRAARNEREKAAIGLTKARETAVATRTTAAMNRVDKSEQRLIDAEKTLNDRKFDLEKVQRQGEIQRDNILLELSGRENIARIEGALRAGLQERAGEIERDIKMGTASPEDKLGWDYITTLKDKGEDHPDTKDALERYKEAMGFRYPRSDNTKSPIQVPENPSDTSSNIDEARRIITGGGGG